MGLSVEIVGLNELLSDVDKAGGNARPLVKAAITNSTSKIQTEARSLALHRSGTLQRSIATQVDYPEGRVSVGEKYGAYIEGGTGIYAGKGRIVPRNAKVLAWKGSGGMVFARSTKGMKARPFFKPGIDKSLSYINNQFTKVIERLITELVGR